MGAVWNSEFPVTRQWAVWDRVGIVVGWIVFLIVGVYVETDSTERTLKGVLGPVCLPLGILVVCCSILGINFAIDNDHWSMLMRVGIVFGSIGLILLMLHFKNKYIDGC